jgi:uncharacterized protein YkwD
MYRSLFVVIAITGASCAYPRPAVRLLGDYSSITSQAMNLNDDTALADYDTRDTSIEVVVQTMAARPQLENRILALVNRKRAGAGVKPLSFSPELAKAAHEHSAAMAREGFFEHRGDGEPALFDRVTASGMDTDHVGENIFETNDGVSGAVADECVEMWMQSDGHRLNMLSPEFGKTGIAVGVSNNGENYITEDFAH